MRGEAETWVIAVCCWVANTLTLSHSHTLIQTGLVIQVDDGNLKVRVTSVTSPTTVLGQALNNHDVREMSLVHVPHAYRCVYALLCVLGGGRAQTGLVLAASMFLCLLVCVFASRRGEDFLVPTSTRRHQPLTCYTLHVQLQTTAQQA